MSQGHKRAVAARRVFDSDDDEEGECTENKNTSKQSEMECEAVSSSENLRPFSAFSDSTAHSTSLFGDTNTRDGSETQVSEVKQMDGSMVGKLKESPRRKSVSVDLEEASMPPLMLNDSIESDSSSSFPTNSPNRNNLDREPGKVEPSTQPTMMEEEKGAGVEGDQDNSSLELSLLWQPSLPPPAQMRKESSEELFADNKVGCNIIHVGKGVVSQFVHVTNCGNDLLPTLVRGCHNTPCFPIKAHHTYSIFLQKSSLTQSHVTVDADYRWPTRGGGSFSEERLSQDMSVDEETQFLDADG